MPALAGPYEVRVEVETLAGAQASASKTVTVQTDGCGVSLAAAEDGCLKTDQDPDTDGNQIVLTAKLEKGDCEKAQLSYTIGDVGKDLEATFADGEASFVITIAEDSGTLDATVVAVHPESDALNDQAPGMFDFDFVSPELAFTSPDESLSVLSLVNDEDGLTPGIQFTVAGTIDGASTSFERGCSMGGAR